MRSSVLAALAIAWLSGCGGPSETSGSTTSTGGSGSSTTGGGGAGGGPVDCADYAIPKAEDGACNGAKALCDRAFDAVAYPTTHNAMSNAQDGWLAPNQSYPVVRQLRDGIRGLMLDTHENADGVPSLCHGNCAFGEQPLVDGLREIAAFLQCNPREVVTIIFEAYVTPDETAGAFENSGLVDYVHVQAKGAPWPTLAELIAKNERLIALTDDPAGQPDYYEYVWDHAWDNPYAAATPADMKCEVGRGDPANPLFIFNHFLTNPTADKTLAEQVNHNPFFLDRVQACAAQTSDFPNFVTVDFYEIGDVLAVAKTLNGL